MAESKLDVVASESGLVMVDSGSGAEVMASVLGIVVAMSPSFWRVSREGREPDSLDLADSWGSSGLVGVGMEDSSPIGESQGNSGIVA